MWKYKYGTFIDDQEQITKKYMQKQIYFLLLYVDKKTKDEYQGVDVLSAFNSILLWFGGLNDLLGNPAELVRVSALLEAAKNEYQSPDFNYAVYRKLVLDAGSEVMKIKGVD